MKKIAITGPESSGKSTLAKLLAKYFNATLIEEYSRIYLKGKDAYSKEDVINIAKDQYELYMKGCNEDNKILISDTDMSVMKIWYEEKYKESSEVINKLFSAQEFDLHLLMKPDIPWVHDPLRESEFEREYLFERYKQLLDSSDLPYTIIEGPYDQRLSEAKSCIEGLL